ncbi:Alkaline phosphatase PafA precursor [Anatilimnocola aggregata]|uniref:Alkaline phosphatase PafA n=1 Tax=Anatilimnocola aggregata TaxID=2528021 RepID=A0A517YLL6_9BACT|nr:alkaline phosphatase family protein [Anatilimnocola aggregata]QDU31125.1 Alkaline phosphatase PafA precursor [Anatilimnocola aggregata]
MLAFTRLFPAAAVLFGLIAAADLRVSNAQPAAPTGPKLLVVVSVDQFCQDYLIRFQDNFPLLASDSLFRNVLQGGAYFPNCHHAHAFTITAPGHAVQLTGTYPGTNGVIENDWFDRETGKTRYCVSDPTVEVVGLPAGKPMSPRVLLVDTVGDRLKIATGGKGKVFGVAIKDRASILMTGHKADCAFWLEKNQWVTSTYYRSDLPGYMRNLNNSKAVEQFRGKVWDLLLTRDRYHNNGHDDNPFENPPTGWTAAFPHKMAKVGELTPDKYGDHVLFSHFGNEYTLLAARQIIEHEKLGADEIPDLLAINFSSNDYVGHAFGPLSLEVEDITYRTDRQLAEFVKYLDDQVGKGRWTLALTADHGVAPIPEMVAERLQDGEQALPAKRNPIGDLNVVREKLEALLRDELKIAATSPKVILDLDANQVYLNYDHPALTLSQLVKARQLVRDWLLKLPYVAAVATREELLGGGSARLLQQMRLSFNPARSGDVLFCYTPYSIPGYSTTAKPKGTTHGSPWHYDTHVPLLLLGQGIIPGRYDRRISPAYLAPTASRLLGVDSPSGCEVDPLHEVLQPVKKF